MSNIPISSLPVATSLAGDEYVPIVQGGTTKRATIGSISVYPLNPGSPFVVATTGSGLAGARLLSPESTVTTVTDGGAGGNITVGVATNGISNAKFRQSVARSVVGNASNATANVADIQGAADQILRVTGAGTSLGFGSIDLSKSAAVGSSILAVVNGGTGLATLTAYALLAGGTTATGAVQSLSGVGTTGQVLTSAGAGVLPGWATLSLTSVTAIADLKALPKPPDSPTTVNVSGYFNAGDGGGGQFYWSSGSSASDNGGTIITPNAGGTGRWLRQVPIYGDLFVGWFGAIPNDGVDDAAAVAACVAALPSTGGTVRFGSGRYVFATKPFSLSSVLAIKIEGTGSADNISGFGTELQYTAASGSILTADHVRGLEISNLAITYTSVSYAGDLVDLRASSSPLNAGIDIHHFMIGGAGSAVGAASLVRLGNTLKVDIRDGFMVNAVTGIKADDTLPINVVEIDNVWFNGTLSTIPVLMGGQNWHINSCVFEPHILSPLTAGAIKISAQNAYSCAITNCNIPDATGDVGTCIDFGTGGVMYGGDISGNFFSRYAFAIDLGASVDVKITNNYFDQLTDSGPVKAASATNVMAYANYVNSHSAPGTGHLFTGALPANSFVDPNDGTGLTFTGTVNYTSVDPIKLATNSRIDWGAGDIRVTGGANLLAFSGAGNGYTFDNFVYPSSSGIASIGSSGNGWSGLFLAGSSSGVARVNAPAVAGTNIYTLPAATDTIVGRASTDTLTNKTIDTAGPNTIKINGNTLSASAGAATVTIPNSTTTLVGRDTTDTLTNKTFDTAGTGNSFKINGLAATDNTGTGKVVRDTTPTLVTPVLGVATATSINKMAITAPATSSTLAVADGKTLTASNTLTFAGPDTTTIDFGAWTAYTPTLTTAGGNFTSATATGRYKKWGKDVVAVVTVVITTNGGASGAVQVGIPTASKSGTNYAGYGFNQTSGLNYSVGIYNSVSTAFMQVFNYAAGYAGGDGTTFTVQIEYETP